MKMGRPTCQLDSDRLAALRKEKGVTQRQLAQRVYSRLGWDATEEAMERHYQRIENTGRTSPEFAKSLAEELGTTVTVLMGQGPEEAPPDRVDELEEQLQAQLLAGSNALLQSVFEGRKSTNPSVRALACSLAAQIEAAQFGQQAEELEKLSRLTGWTMEQVNKPMSLDGYWLMFSAIHGGGNAEVFSGATGVMLRIQRDATQYISPYDSDLRICLREEKPWYHVILESSQLPLGRITFSFVRCVPQAYGLKYVSPTWRDRCFLDKPLREWAFQSANFVVGMDRETQPTDVRRLRLLIETCNAMGKISQLAVVKGDIDDLRPSLLVEFQEEGRGHDLVTNWLSAGLWDVLAPHLSKWPRSCWKVAAGWCISLELCPPHRMAMVSDDARPYGLKFRIRLVEENGDGQHRPAPWRDHSVALVAQRLERELISELPDEVPDIAESRK